MGVTWSFSCAHLGEQQDELGIHVGGISQDGMTVYTGMLKVDSSFTI
jgi:hypothetical protein